MEDTEAQRLFKLLPDMIDGRYVKLQIQWIGAFSRTPVMATLVEELTDRDALKRAPRRYRPEFNLEDEINTIEDGLRHLVKYCREQGYIS